MQNVLITEQEVITNDNDSSINDETIFIKVEKRK